MEREKNRMPIVHSSGLMTTVESLLSVMEGSEESLGAHRVDTDDLGVSDGVVGVDGLLAVEVGGA